MYIYFLKELLNLEERIGSVNTGLSEDSMSKCLREKVYYSSSDQNQNQNHEEVSCPICLVSTCVYFSFHIHTIQNLKSNK